MAAPAKEAALPIYTFCRQQGKVSSREPQFCGFKTIPLFLFHDGKHLNPTDPTGYMGGVSCLSADERSFYLA